MPTPAVLDPGGYGPSSTFEALVESFDRALVRRIGTKNAWSFSRTVQANVLSIQDLIRSHLPDASVLDDIYEEVRGDLPPAAGREDLRSWLREQLRLRAANQLGRHPDVPVEAVVQVKPHTIELVLIRPVSEDSIGPLPDSFESTSPSQ